MPKYVGNAMQLLSPNLAAIAAPIKALKASMAQGPYQGWIVPRIGTDVKARESRLAQTTVGMLPCRCARAAAAGKAGGRPERMAALSSRLA
jgi:hypothetical protein